MDFLASLTGGQIAAMTGLVSLLAATMGGMFGLATSAINAWAQRSQARQNALRDYYRGHLLPFLELLDRSIDNYQSLQILDLHKSHGHLATLVSRFEPVPSALIVVAPKSIGHGVLYFSTAQSRLKAAATGTHDQQALIDGCNQCYILAASLRHQLVDFIFYGKTMWLWRYRRQLKSAFKDLKAPILNIDDKGAIGTIYYN